MDIRQEHEVGGIRLLLNMAGCFPVLVADHDKLICHPPEETK
jgi:hypothetical protein